MLRPADIKVKTDTKLYSVHILRPADIKVENKRHCMYVQIS